MAIDALPGLLRAICVEPHADDLRLICADWFEQQGQTKRAELVRLQIELAKYPQQVAWLEEMPVESWTGSPEEGLLLRRLDRLKQYEEDLLDGRAWRWAGAVFRAAVVKAVPPGPHWKEILAFRRGFVERIALTLADFDRHAAALFNAAPILNMRLTDCSVVEAMSDPSEYYWVFPHRTVYPHALLDVPGMPGPFSSLAEGKAAVSDACVRLGRQRAGLPALTPQPVAPTRSVPLR